MSINNDSSLQKLKPTHIPGCVTPLNCSERIPKKSTSQNESSSKKAVNYIPYFELCLDKVNETALEVIKTHNKEHGHKNISKIENSFSSKKRPSLISLHNGTQIHKLYNDLTLQNISKGNLTKKTTKTIENGSNLNNIPNKSSTPTKPPENPPLSPTITNNNHNHSLPHPTKSFTTNHLKNERISLTKSITSLTPLLNNLSNVLSLKNNNKTINNIPTCLNITSTSSTTKLISTTTTTLNSTAPTTLTTSNTSISTTPIPSTTPPKSSQPSPATDKNMTLCLSKSPPNRLPNQQNSLKHSNKISKYLNSGNIQLSELKRICWSGIPHHCRSLVWKLLCSYIPLNPDKRQSTLTRKRKDYLNMVNEYYHDPVFRKSHYETYHQIHIDVPRMSPCIPIFKQTLVQQIFERVLFTWAIRHPASGYVQGMNDLLTPFFIVFITPYVNEDKDLKEFSMDLLCPEVISQVEADSFWCFSRLLDGIQDNYTFAQPGIQKQVNILMHLMATINKPLHQHLSQHNIEYLQFAFRWMNNLLMRELPLMCCIRLWDTYLCESDGFATFHLYVCGTLLNRFSQHLLKQQDFQGLMLFLKSLPTEHWDDSDVALLLADAYALKYSFADVLTHYS